MKLTPLDIRKQQFKKVMRGYDPIEVDTFMEMLGNEFEEAMKNQKEMRDKTVELETQLRDYRQIEKTLQQTLLQAQETTGRTYESARREAETILRDAQSKGDRMVEQAAGQLKRTNAELLELQTRKESFIARMRLLLATELELLKAMESNSQGSLSGGAPAKERIPMDEFVKSVDDADQGSN